MAGAELTDTRYADDVAAAEDLLWGVAVGTWLLTYDGFSDPTGELRTGPYPPGLAWGTTAAEETDRWVPTADACNGYRHVPEAFQGQLWLIMRRDRV